MNWDIFESFRRGSVEELRAAVAADNGPEDLLEGLRTPIDIDALIYEEDALPKIQLVEKIAQGEHFPLEWWLGDVLGAALRFGRGDVAQYFLQGSELLPYVRPREQTIGLARPGTDWALYRWRHSPHLSRAASQQLHQSERILAVSLATVLSTDLVRYLTRVV